LQLGLKYPFESVQIGRIELLQTCNKSISVSRTGENTHGYAKNCRRDKPAAEQFCIILTLRSNAITVVLSSEQR